MKRILLPVLISLSFFCYSQTAEEYSDRGNAKYLLEEDNRGAIQDFNKSIELKPTALAYYNRGYSKGKLEDYHGAIQDFTKAIELEPEYALAYYFRGIAKYELGDINGGCLDLSKAGELGDETAYDTIRDLCN